MLTYASNLIKLARSDRHLDPRVAIYYVTTQCNLNCAYCEDFGARRNDHAEPPLPLGQALRVLRVIRSGVEALFITGGEPLLHPEIDELLGRAKREMKFREITLITNGFLLGRHEAALSAVDRLIVSLDSLDAESWSQTIGVPAASAGSIHANIRNYALRQREFGYRMMVNAVLSPETLSGAGALLEFCVEHHLLISFSPQAVNNWVRYELIVSPEYQTFIRKLIAYKKRGAPIAGSIRYLQTLINFQPYDCYPTLAPRIMPNGDLTYPCRPFEKADQGQGGRGVNLLDVQDWAEAWRRAQALYGQPPRTCHSCFQQCYIEPSLMQSRPFTLLYEYLRYPPSRNGNLKTYAAG
ncbi:MAG TPA: radical SAM protein [Anaerolineales bacterium]|nr:radical SAM protein [Anaerolineales bacterium]